jgi:hypothetical protein
MKTGTLRTEPLVPDMKSTPEILTEYTKICMMIFGIDEAEVEHFCRGKEADHHSVHDHVVVKLYKAFADVPLDIAPGCDSNEVFSEMLDGKTINECHGGGSLQNPRCLYLSDTNLELSTTSITNDAIRIRINSESNSGNSDHSSCVRESMIMRVKDMTDIVIKFVDRFEKIGV